jgi:hypothetical protein
VGDVLDLDVHGRGVEQVEPPPGEHPLPGSRFGFGPAQPFSHLRVPFTVKVVN